MYHGIKSGVDDGYDVLVVIISVNVNFSKIKEELAGLPRGQLAAIS